MQQDICKHSNDKAQTKFFTSEYYRKKKILTGHGTSVDVVTALLGTVTATPTQSSV